MALTLPAFSDGCFVHLPVISPHVLHEIPRAFRACQRMAVDTARIDKVRFLQLVPNTCLLREIPIRQMHMWEEIFGLLVDAPPNDAHLCCISKASRLAFDLLLLMCSVNEIMARLTQRDEIVWTVPTGFP
jgi:hypothetical protein